MLEAQIKRGLSAAVVALALGFLVTNWIMARTSAQSSGNQAGNQGGNQGGNQTTASTPNPDDPPAEQAFKNIQVLKGMPKSQMDPVMNMFSAALGMRCDQCHVLDAL